MSLCVASIKLSRCHNCTFNVYRRVIAKKCNYGTLSAIPISYSFRISTQKRHKFAIIYHTQPPSSSIYSPFLNVTTSCTITTTATATNNTPSTTPTGSNTVNPITSKLSYSSLALESLEHDSEVLQLYPQPILNLKNSRFSRRPQENDSDLISTSDVDSLPLPSYPFIRPLPIYTLDEHIALIDACIRIGNMERASILFHRLCKTNPQDMSNIINVKMMNAFLEGYFDINNTNENKLSRNNLEEGVRWFKSFKEYDVEPDSNTFGILLKVIIRYKTEPENISLTHSLN